MAVVDEVSPASYGEDRIVLSVVPGQTPRQFEAVLIDVDYSACDPAGVVLPLEAIVTQESGASTFQRQTFDNLAPSQLAVVPREGGQMLVRLAEKHHNRWFGALEISVAGELVVKR
jgi:hypothetical protein